MEDLNKTFILLKLRHLIAGKEFTIARCNYELQKYSEWRCDWAGLINDYDKEIVEMILKYEEIKP